MRFGNIDVGLDNEVEELLDRAINKDNRNILILGQTGTGKSVLLKHLIYLCRNNKNIIDGERNIDVRKVIEENAFNNSMCALGGVKTTAILDEFHRLKDGYDLLFREYRHLYENYIISVHSGGLGNNIGFIEELLSKELISWLNPITLKTAKEWGSREYTLEISESGKQIYKGRGLSCRKGRRGTACLKREIT